MSDSIHKLFSIMNSLSIKIIEMIESFVLIPRFPFVVDRTYSEWEFHFVKVTEIISANVFSLPL